MKDDDALLDFIYRLQVGRRDRRALWAERALGFVAFALILPCAVLVPAVLLAAELAGLGNTVTKCLVVASLVVGLVAAVLLVRASIRENRDPEGRPVMRRREARIAAERVVARGLDKKLSQADAQAARHMAETARRNGEGYEDEAEITSSSETAC